VLQERICRCRRHTGWGPRLVAGATGHPHSTVWKVLARHGISRPARPVKEPANRYEWPCPGDLLHMDVSRYSRFERPGHAVTADRSQRSRNWMDPSTRVGTDYAHAIVDDHTRLAYVELHNDEKAATVTGFVERALAWFQAHGITTRRLMTDNAFAYIHNRSLRELLARQQIKHLRTQPYRPRTNGKVERFHQTMAREWGYGLAYRTHRHRNRALPHWLRYYNERRPHSAIGGLPPSSRVHNVRGQDTLVASGPWRRSGSPARPGASAAGWRGSWRTRESGSGCSSATARVRLSWPARRSWSSAATRMARA
jgi:transposase InsO family protein